MFKHLTSLSRGSEDRVVRIEGRSLGGHKEEHTGVNTESKRLWIRSAVTAKWLTFPNS